MHYWYPHNMSFPADTFLIVMQWKNCWDIFRSSSSSFLIWFRAFISTLYKHNILCVSTSIKSSKEKYCTKNYMRGWGQEEACSVTFDILPRLFPPAPAKQFFNPTHALLHNNEENGKTVSRKVQFLSWRFFLVLQKCPWRTVTAGCFPGIWTANTRWWKYAILFSWKRRKILDLKYR